MFLHKPAEQTGERRKFARPYHGPYRVIEMATNTAKITRIDHPEEDPLLVSLAQLRQCPEKIGNEFWPPSKKRQSATQPQTPTGLVSGSAGEDATGTATAVTVPDSSHDSHSPGSNPTSNVTCVSESPATHSGDESSVLRESPLHERN